MRTPVRSFLLTSVVAAALWLPAAGLAQGQKIGVVDMQRALNETEDGRAAKAKLEKYAAKRQKDLNAKQESLKQLKDTIEKQQSVLERPVLEKKVEEYQKSAMELQSTYMEFQREFQAKEMELTQDIVLRMREIMKRVGHKEGYTLILDRNEAGVVFVPGSYDLTDVLIQQYNAEHGKGGKKRKKAK